MNENERQYLSLPHLHSLAKKVEGGWGAEQNAEVNDVHGEKHPRERRLYTKQQRGGEWKASESSHTMFLTVLCHQTGGTTSEQGYMTCFWMQTQKQAQF